MGFFDRFKKKTVEPQESEDSGMKISDPFFDSFLNNEAKFRHQRLEVKRSTKDEPTTLGYILQDLLQISPEDIGPMAIVSRGEDGISEFYETMESRSDILAYNPFATLHYTNANDEILPRTGQNTVLMIGYRVSFYAPEDNDEKKDKSKLCTDNSIIMYLRMLGPFVDDTAYMRVSVMIPNFSCPDDFCTQNSKNTPFTTSFILGYDLRDPDKKLRRYEVIEKELMEKLQRDEPLSHEEEIVLEGITYSKDLGHDFGYGRWLVSQHRYTDALIPLMKAYNHLKKGVVTDSAGLAKIFEETCFNIGFCFNELEQFDRAAYYLAFAVTGGKPHYTIEYINALVNGGAPTALQVVQHYLREFNTGKMQRDTEEYAMFYEFLARRLAYLYIEYEMWDAARQLLNQMKDSPHSTSREFAISELNYINEATAKH